MRVSLTDYIVGALYFVLVVGSAGAAAGVVVRGQLAWMAFEARIVAWTLLVMASLAFVHLVPLILGVLTRGTAAGTSLALLIAVTRIPARSSGAHESSRGLPASRLQWSLAALALTVGVGFMLAFLRANGKLAISDIDSTMFHLPGMAGWIRSGSVWHAQDFVPGWGFGAYPQTGNLLQLAVVLPWHNDFLLRALNPGFLALGGVTVYALAAELHVPRPLAATFAVVAVTVPIAGQVGLENGGTDVMMATALVAGLLFLIRHTRTGRRSELVLGGLGLGLAFGTKWYGPPDALVVLIVALLATRARPGALRGLVLVGLVALATGGFWLLRNVIIYANPIFPARVSVFGATISDGPERTASTGIAHSLLLYAGNGHLLRTAVWPQLVLSFALTGALLLLGTIAALILAARGRELRVVCCAGVTLGVLVVWIATPDSALRLPNGALLVISATRYALPAVFIGAAVSAWVAARLQRAASVAQLFAIVAIGDALSRERGYLGVTLPAIALAAAVVAVAGGIGAPLARRARRASTPALIGVVGTLAVALLGGGRAFEQDFNATRYRGIEPVFDYLATHGRPQHVALAGHTGRSPYSSPIVAFGPRYENDVAYVGPRDHHLLVGYRTSGGFVRALAAGGFGLLLVGDRDPELGWARAAGWTPIAIDNGTTNGFALLRPAGGAAPPGATR